VLNPARGDAPQLPPMTWRRLSVFASVLVVAMAVVTTVDVVRIGVTGAQSVWQDVGH
jgi:hypothetical protein